MMRRYCTKCKKHVEITIDNRRMNEVCTICGTFDVAFTLRQRILLSKVVKRQESAQVRSIQFTRKNETGLVLDTNIEGASLDFLKDCNGGTRGPSIEFWNWDELEVAHLLNDAEINTDEGTRLSGFHGLRFSDTIMFCDGSIASVGRLRVHKLGDRRQVFGLNVWKNRKFISRLTLPVIVDWLSRIEYEVEK